MNRRGIGPLVAAAGVIAVALLYGIPGPHAVSLVTVAMLAAYVVSKDEPKLKA